MPYKDKEKRKESSRKAALKYYHRNKEKRAIYHKKYVAMVRDKVFNRYGGYICSCCGVTHRAFLTIDHINGGGTKHRKETQGGGNFTYRWIHMHGYPDGFRVLCYNCNSGRARNGGICPHEEKKIAK